MKQQLDDSAHHGHFNTHDRMNSSRVVTTTRLDDLSQINKKANCIPHRQHPVGPHRSDGGREKIAGAVKDHGHWGRETLTTSSRPSVRADIGCRLAAGGDPSPPTGVGIHRARNATTQMKNRRHHRSGPSLAGRLGPRSGGKTLVGLATHPRCALLSGAKPA